MPRESRNKARIKRHKRVRNKVSGTEAQPRLNVFRSHKHIYAQIINDRTGTTLITVSSLDPELGNRAYGGNIAAAKKVGTLLAKKALERDINRVVFDRGGYKYHGRVAALADAAREAGLEF
ncbi:MAG: 50S ribosomal protein L18 [Firmicutes bacterium]|nr:50S ribosomal protein L18 [Bacillota bacterium]